MLINRIAFQAWFIALTTCRYDVVARELLFTAVKMLRSGLNLILYD